MKRGKIKRGPVIVLSSLLLIGAFFGINKAKSNGAFAGIETKMPKLQKAKKVKIAIVTWGGFMGGPLYNKGFTSSDSSEFKKLGYDVEFVVNDDPSKTLEMWLKDDIDIHWYTADAFSFISSEYASHEPRMIMQSDWSRGGDAIVAGAGISNVSQLKGKTVAVAPKTPSYTFLIKALEANNMTVRDVNIVEVSTAVGAAEKFKSKTIDAAVVWSPDDQDCINSVRGSSIITSTKEATNIIADIFFAKKKFIEKNPELIKVIVEGWLKGNALINSSPEAKTRAVNLMASGMNQDVDFCETSINNVRFATYGDNVNFFGVNKEFAGITGEQIYNVMGNTYVGLGLLTDYPSWRECAYTNHLREITNLTGDEHAAEKALAFDKTKTKTVAFANKNVTINFLSGSSELSPENKASIDNTIAQTLLEFAGAKVRIEGNTDNVGNPTSNQILSKVRAKAVVDYLVETYNFDNDRFVVMGNGSNNPIADNATESGKAMNRRTEIVLMR